jgi:ankyrin repeat protein
MERFEYKSVDLKDSSFRLVRLLYGEDGPIQCELFDTWLRDTNVTIEYEALSYTWGGMDKPYEIEIHGRGMSVTENLLLALRRLRYPDRDRILWIDAICIDQTNHGERVHQVRQMASIYKRAEQVVIWLGPPTSEIDLVFRHMHGLEEEALKHASNSWNPSDQRWQDLWTTVQLLLGNVRGDSIPQLREGLRSLLSRSWFKRAWIIQEVAMARSARVMCGTKSVSARIFAIFPGLLGITPDTHCQAILDIMPGPSRKHSWWTQTRDLHTLLRKFRDSEATDLRDVIYALLGISSDGCDTDILVPNYKEPVEEIVRATVAFLLHLRYQKNSMLYLPQWSLSEFLQNIDSLGRTVFIWASENRHTSLLSQLLDSDKIDVDSKDDDGRTPLWWAAQNGHDEAILMFLLDTGKVDVDLKDKNGRTPLWCAAQNGHEAIVKLLVQTGKADMNLKDEYGRTPLCWAAQNGNEGMVKLLLDTGKADVNLMDEYGRTPLYLATHNAHEAVVRLLLEMGEFDVNSTNKYERVKLLHWAAQSGHGGLAKLLSDAGKADMNLKDEYGRTPLCWAAQNGNEGMVKLLLDTCKADVNLKDKGGLTPLWWATHNEHAAVVQLLLKIGKVDIESKDENGYTPLWWATRIGNQAIVKLLLDTGKVDVNVKGENGRTPLWWAERNGNKAILKLLLDSGKITSATV